MKQIYFGNWLRDFSQIIDKGSLSLVPYPVLRALIAVFAFVQFGYATREFEVTDERLGAYRPEEHVDNPRGYDAGIPAASSSSNRAEGNEPQTGYRISDGLRGAVEPTELAIDGQTGMKNYIANSHEVGMINPTSRDYVEKQLIAAIACGRQSDQEAYIHLGAALHTLEDFVAHSNYVELAMQLIGRDVEDRANMTPALKNVFTYVGGNAKVNTASGEAAPIITGTFGALDLLQTILGEVEDRLNAMSLPGLRVRTSGDGGALQSVAKYLVGLLGGLTPDFEKDIMKVQKAAARSEGPSWGELESTPELLWKSLEPVFKLRDDIVKWVYDHLAIRAVQDAIAAISTAIDKLVYMVLGIFLTPLLSQFSEVLKKQEQQLLKQDQAARLATGEQSIFDESSSADDPTHSQLAKDHYDDVLNEVAGRVAVRISGYTTTKVIQLWQPGTTEDPRQSINEILDTFHHPFNNDPNSAIQNLMLSEVRAYVNESLLSGPVAFTSTLQSLSTSSVASRIGEHATVASGHSARPQTEHAAAGESRTAEKPGGFMDRLNRNIERQIQEGAVKGIGVDDLPMIKDALRSSPSGDNPSPLDSALSKVPGISFLNTFEGITIGEIASADGMGETLKDAVVTMILLDEDRGIVEEDLAADRFGEGKKQDREQERARLREMRALLKIEKAETQQKEGQFDEKKSTTDRLKTSFGKLKLKGSK